MIASAELRTVTAFSDLPDDQIDWFLSQAVEVRVKAGEAFVQQGDPANWMIIFLDGLFQWRGEFGGDTVAMPAQAGEVSGVFPFSRMKHFTVTGRALTNGRLLKFPAACLPQLIQKMPELTTRLVGMMSDRIREGTRIEQQRDRLVSLGKLSAGLAHEMNNPGSAAQRAAAQMRGTLEKMRAANSSLWRSALLESQMAKIEEIESAMLKSAGAIYTDELALSDLEEQLNSLLARHRILHPWQFSPVLASFGVTLETLDSMLKELETDAAHAALARITTSAQMLVLLSTIENATVKISDLIQTVKQYTSMDRAPMQNVDAVQSLETTLITLAHILQPGIQVRREYQPIPVLVNAVGTELNQVWTNIIENAVEAMHGVGELRLRTFQDDRFVVVEIADNGPGIPPEIRSRIFDPFFTTKGVGEGTGLGLNTAQTIVRKHGGSIQVSTRPGDTRMQVWLPWADQLEVTLALDN